MHVSETFIDWLDLKQDHLSTHMHKQTGRNFEEFETYHGGIYAKGRDVTWQREGGNVYLLLVGDADDPQNCGFGLKRGRREGSFSTSVGLRSDGRIVHLSGNIGRLDRPDNLWNYGLVESVVLANNAIANCGNRLPGFSKGVQFLRESISATDHRKGVSPWYWSGAVCNEVHVTRNYYAGSDVLACETLRDMRGRRLARVSKAAFGDETVSFGMPTRKGQRLHKGVVVYRKGPEMLAHAKGDEAKSRIKASQEYQLAMDTGLVRVECKFGAHYLRENNQRYLGDMDMGKLIALYNRETAPLLLARPDDSIRLVEHMPRPLRMSALSWIDGRDLRSILARTTFKRHRRQLLEYGLDVSEPRSLGIGHPNAEQALQSMLDALPQHSLKPMSAPDWYGLTEVRAA